MDPSDSVEAAVLRRSGSSAFRLEVPDRELLAVARERLLTLVRLRDERPARTAHRPRSVGRILRDFEFGLLARDADVTTECIRELREAGQLGATNLLFLEVRRLEALGQWAAILAIPELVSLLAMARPRRVTEALIRAIYALQLREFETGERAAEALARFRTHVFAEFGDLYRSRAGLSGYEIDASFLLACAASEPPRCELAQSILSSYGPGEPGRYYLAALAALTPCPPIASVPQRDQLSEAQEAFALADIDRAYGIASVLPVSVEAAVLLLRCAREMGTLAAARVALKVMDGLADAERQQIATHAVFGRFLEPLRALLVPVPVAAAPESSEIPSSWAEWLQRVCGLVPWRAAVTVAEVGGREWGVESIASDGEAIARTADLIISDRPPWGQTALRDSLPYLVECFLSKGTDARYKAIYENLFLTIVVDNQVSLPQIATLLRIAEALLQLGVSSTEYADIIGQIASALEAAESASVADLALDAVDMLANEVCPVVAEREQLVLRVATIFRRWYRRIDASQWALLRRLACELQVPDAVGRETFYKGTTDTASIWSGLERKRVALYSLRAPALRRVQATLRELCPNVDVQTFSDHVGGSQTLRAASASADIFVIATAAAKHAATLYIEANRSKSSVTLYARGQGSASLLDSVREYLHRAFGIANGR